LFKATLAFKSEPRRAIRAIYPARRACDWEFAARLEPQVCGIGEGTGQVDEGTPWRLLFLASAGAAQQLTTARQSAKRIGDLHRGRLNAAARASKRERLRIGFLSGDFFSHPVSHLMVGVIERHDRARFEVIGYDFSPPADDEYRTRLEAAFDH